MKYLVLVLGQFLICREELGLIVGPWELEHGDAVYELGHVGLVATVAGGFLDLDKYSAFELVFFQRDVWAV